MMRVVTMLIDIDGTLGTNEPTTASEMRIDIATDLSLILEMKPLPLVPNSLTVI
ncbi:hypothetical protein MNB_SUP05-SYMBIONT-7-286 [hydrothermal vent metagenome]|uniref:Uncharacterized protein n=1 Tax=hydrothermal vent metagenome TaxID=652676 RepID=A0A1W1E265_9ZZZZ